MFLWSSTALFTSPFNCVVNMLCVLLLPGSDLFSKSMLFYRKGNLWSSQKNRNYTLNPCSWVSSLSWSYLHYASWPCRHMYVCVCPWHWFWSKHAVMCQCDRMGAHDLQTLWLLAQIRTIKNRSWDNEPGWHTCSWRNSKDVSQPPSFPHVIMSGEWLRLVITHRRRCRAEGDLHDRVYSADTTVEL